MDPHSTANPHHPHPEPGPPSYLPHANVPQLPPPAAPGDWWGRDPVGWWEVIGGTWRWITNPNA